ncbi:MAG: epoxyqueuosine reductase [Pirellulaceae bacterium]|nr:MAG: epoxyqueuosine reductase [Pirellulaceae bacterium]
MHSEQNGNPPGELAAAEAVGSAANGRARDAGPGREEGEAGVEEFTRRLKQRALELGFSACGACPAVEAARFDKLRQWITQGFAGAMHYIERRLDAYRHPQGVLPGVRSLLMLVHHYGSNPTSTPPAGYGRVARYAWGCRDYHDVIREKLHKLVEWVKHERPGTWARGVVDTAPLLERDYAQLAGLGWIGKNTLLLRTGEGSYFFLAALLMDCPLVYDQPYQSDHCGTCRACLDACPTQAFVEPYVMDATRCISYLTIELREMIPEALRAAVGDWVFGCDVCQEVCPWNRRSKPPDDPAYFPVTDLAPLELTGLFDLDEEQFRRRFGHTPLARAGRAGLLRNAAIVLGNQRAEAARPALEKGLHDPSPLVRAASAWALGQLTGEKARRALAVRLSQETDPQVLEEIERALAGWPTAPEQEVGRPASD